MKLHMETVHDPSGLPAYRLYEYGPFSITTWPGKNNRDGKPRIQEYKGRFRELTRPTAAHTLRIIRSLRHFAP